MSAEVTLTTLCNTGDHERRRDIHCEVADTHLVLAKLVSMRRKMVPTV